MPLTTWIAVPLLGAAIGYLTNRIAVRMIFRPIRPVNVLGLRVQGLMGRRQKDLAESIGRVVGEHLISHDDIVAAFEHVDLEDLMRGVMDRALGPKVDELRRLPLVGSFLTDERVTDLQASIVRGILEHKSAIYERLEQAVENELDVHEIVTRKVAAFPVEKIEELVLAVAAKELRAIEVLGGVLGGLIGVVQVVVVQLLG